MNPMLIDQIYEAAIFQERWPQLLQFVADQVGARGATFMIKSPNALRAVASTGIGQLVDDFIALGWSSDPARVQPLIDEQYPGFRVETDYRTPEQIHALPVYREFLIPRNLVAGAATTIQGSTDRAVFLSFEGFGSHDAARAAVPALDRLRPHLARAISLSALHSQRTQIIVDSLALVGAAAAVVCADGQLRYANQLYTDRLGAMLTDSRLGLRFTDPFLQRQYLAALDRHRATDGMVQSVAVRGADGSTPFAIHILPITGAARDLCDADGVLLLVADGANDTVPDADLLRLLFDLTPAEARLARLIAKGHSVTDAGKVLAITAATGRVHLKSIFAKLGVQRQIDLSRMLTGLGSPVES